VRAEHAVKVYGTGDTAVTALDDVTVEFPAGRFTGILAGIRPARRAARQNMITAIAA
jgi:hypothetical protein